MTWWSLFRSARVQKLKKREEEIEHETILARHRNLQAVERLKIALRNSPEVDAVKSISGSFK